MDLNNFFRKKSPWLIHVPTGSCNGCAIEILAALTPRYDLERFGAIIRGSPRHADIILAEGPVTGQYAKRLKTIYSQVPDPKVVISIGACSMGGVFYNCYNQKGGIDKVIPVDVYVPGCPPKPESIIDAVIAALKKLEDKVDRNSTEGTRSPKKRKK